MEADEALAAFAAELVRSVIALSVPGESIPKLARDPLAVPPARKGAGAVHPHLGHHLLTVHPGDTISAHAYAHVPRPYEIAPPAEPDAKDLKVEEQKKQIEQQEKALQGVRDYRSAARELDRHAADLASKGIPLPGTWKPWTPDEHASHERFTDDAVQRGMETRATTVTETHDGAGQVWRPERAAAHKDIIQGFLDKAEKVPSAGKAVLAGGIPSQQRDAVARLAAPDSDYLHVSTDAVKAEMARRGLVPEVRGLSPMEASPLAHDEATHVARLLLHEATRRGKNVAVHTAMADPGAVRALTGNLQAAGYAVHGAFAHVHPDRAADSQAARHRSGHESWRRQASDGHKYLPPALIRQAHLGDGHTVNAAAFEDLKQHLPSWEHWDATEGAPRKTGSGGSYAPHHIPAPEQLVGLTADQDRQVRLSAILDWLEMGRITLADACNRLRRLSLHEGAPRAAAQVLAHDANGDLHPLDKGRFAAVEAAYVAGKLTRHQYEQIAQAVSPA